MSSELVNVKIESPSPSPLKFESSSPPPLEYTNPSTPPGYERVRSLPPLPDTPRPGHLLGRRPPTPIPTADGRPTEVGAQIYCGAPYIGANPPYPSQMAHISRRPESHRNLNDAVEYRQGVLEEADAFHPSERSVSIINNLIIFC